MKNYDVAVVGGGPGGYIAAEEAAKYGNSVAIIENNHLGGTCLNTGCIPSKTLLRHSEVIELMKKAKQWGIEYENLSISLEKMLRRKNKVIENLRAGVASLLNQVQVDVYNGTATVQQDNRISIDKKEEIRANKIIIATGSKPFIPPIQGVEHTNVHTTDTIFDIERVPDSLVIIGGGVIGVEIACVFSSLNVDVTIIEMTDRLIAGEDEDAAEQIRKTLEQTHVNIHTSSQVEEVAEKPNGKIVHVTTENGELLAIEADELLFASGRKPNLSAVSKLHLQMNGPFIAVNKQMQTSRPNIYAVGDVVGGWQLAHVASAEGVVAAANASHEAREIDYTVVPRCIYSLPEIASVGLSEKEAKEKGHEVRTETFPLQRNGKAFAMDERTGFIKLIAGEAFNEILGIVMVGPHVTEMISEASAFIALEGTVSELASMIHPHPTLSEGIWEVARSWLANKQSPVMTL
ncbi:dihydrolipoyl dehydrogenase [Halobacillus sp. MO56]